MTDWIEFLNPERLWWLLLIPGLAVLYVVLNRLRNDSASSWQAVQQMVQRESNWKRHLAVILALASLTALIVAYARPKQEVEVPRERATIVVAIDISLSMEADDVQPNRLAAAQAGATDFINSLPEGYNVGVVAFGGTAQILVPPTPDRGQALAAVDNLTLMPATAIGDGILSSLDALLQVPAGDDPNEELPARIVLLSDGSTTVGTPSAAAAQSAKDRGVPVYTIAYGTEEGYVEIEGRREHVPVAYDELETIAEITGGNAYRAASAEQLSEVYENISSSVGYELVDVEVTNRYAGIGLLLALLSAVGVVSLAARWP
ncbi:VWA domain-containing protein [Naumannella halotolerans]|uniref:Ca-activated chloride channel family protein n=1 Tax=Naumannella halotolerans TaxID=993414 RepID=A0A4R7JA63_9ACTN|nr:VWA domain-containing protein [Naumannella halotolerans]TDT33806.1 Ca-activated chloride channel family protein [Naumannella halotolerans]